MYDLTMARILHIIGVVLGIGGVAFVKTAQQQEVMVGCFSRKNKNKNKNKILKRKHL